MLNEFKLIGYTGSDPVLRNTSEGTTVASCTLATTKKKKDGTEVTQWHKLVFWGKQAEWAEQMITKGSLIYVNGEIEYGYYFNTEMPRQKVNTTEVVVSSFRILKSKSNEVDQ